MAKKKKYDGINEFWAQIDEKIQTRLFEKSLDEVDEIYYRYCLENSGETVANKIREVDFADYRKEISKLLKTIVTKKIPQSRKTDKPFIAAYFEFDSDNQWDSYFFLNYDYEPLFEGKAGDEWACSWSVKDEMEGPSVPDFVKLQIDENFSRNNPEGTGAYVYAHARIFIEFCRACREVGSLVPICLGYHDQAVAIRVFPDSMFEHKF